MVRIAAARVRLRDDHVPDAPMADGKITPDMIQYMVKQLKQDVIPKLEKVSGVKFDIDRLRGT